MIDLQRLPDSFSVQTEDASPHDASLRFVNGPDGLDVYLSAKKSRPRRVLLRWRCRITGDLRLFGDTWERGYGDLSFTGLVPHHALPWYFLLVTETDVEAAGVAVRPNALVSFFVDSEGVTASCDVGCGTAGVALDGRELLVARFLSASYPLAEQLEKLSLSSLPDLTDDDRKALAVFAAGEDFCAAMSPDPLLPAEPVFGGNNWYYAYGKSSREKILSDASLQADLAEGLGARPFMVIDDGWQINPCAGPWLPNENYGDMKSLADAFKTMGVRPGLWFRPLHDPSASIPAAWRFAHRDALDPSLPAVIAYLKETVHRMVFDWGFELIKHDFSTFDIFGHWGGERSCASTMADGRWSFHDTSRTSAEIYKDFLLALLEAAGGKAYLLGCNTLSHLTAGLCHINRTGDDTSGVEWDRTRRMGINTLAFRMMQHRHFYLCDADCAGFCDGKIPFSLNRRWLELLAKSGTPLFVSAPRGAFSPEETAFVKACYADALRTARGKTQNADKKEGESGKKSVKGESGTGKESGACGGNQGGNKEGGDARPLDWLSCAVPRRWLLDGVVREFNWYEE